MAQNKNGVADTNDVHTMMSGSLNLSATLLGGTPAMRAAGTRYLPREPEETTSFYANRLARTVLFNAFKKAIAVLAGKVFKKGLNIENLESPAKEWLENVDLRGSDVTQFGYELFKRGLANGVDYILVDMPSTKQTEMGEPLSIAAEQAMNIRPYFVPVLAADLIGWQSEIINGIQTLAQIRIKETVTEQGDDEFTEINVDQIRVIDIGLARIYRQNIKTKVWDLFSEQTTTFDFIPLVPFYANRIDFFHGESPLIDLAHLNVDHWQKSSDLSNILHLIQVPILVATGVDQKQSIKVGPNTLVKFSDIDSKLTYVEPNAAGTKLGLESLTSLKEQMAVMGTSVLTEKTGSQTATEKALNEGGANSDLAAMAKNFEDTLNTAFKMMYRMAGLNEEAAPVLNINTDFGIVGNGAVTIEHLIKMRAIGEISSETFLNRVNELTGFNINAEDELSRLENELVLDSANDGGNQI